MCKTGFGVLVAGGDSADGVNLQGFVVNSHTGAFDLSVFRFEPTPLRVAQAAVSSGTATGGAADALCGRSSQQAGALRSAVRPGR